MNFNAYHYTFGRINVWPLFSYMLVSISFFIYNNQLLKVSLKLKTFEKKHAKNFDTVIINLRKKKIRCYSSFIDTYV